MTISTFIGHELFLEKQKHHALKVDFFIVIVPKYASYKQNKRNLQVPTCYFSLWMDFAIDGVGVKSTDMEVTCILKHYGLI